MKIFYLIIIVFLSTAFFSQENWMTYPEKNNIDSLEIKSAEQEIEEQTTLEESNNHTDSLKLNINNYISKKGCLIENKYFAFDSINSFLSNSGSYNGYTVQIYVSQETLKIRRVRKDFMINFPEQTLFDEYTAPNIFLCWEISRL